ncbi:hypothetical protein [Jiangella gansuensis]|uniref:hypothetical protein n=1 Tax=Jiangella gansuensis TaxID=281473 RepID=UPI0004B19DA8|nr:hypothetical protein [Jiangella gansuensis]
MAEVVTSGAVGSCAAQRSEFRRSARNVDEYDQMSAMFDDLYPEVSTPKDAWRWIEAAQYRMLRKGAHQSLSLVDLLSCATATKHGLVVLHDDGDFVAAAAHLPDVRQRRVHDIPAG